MAVFPDSMNRLDLNDAPKSLATVEEYIGYIRERVEFAMRNVTRSVNSAGVSSVGLAQEVAELANVVAAMAGTVGALQGEMSQAKSDIAGLRAAAETTTQEITDLKERVEALENPVETP